MDAIRVIRQLELTKFCTTVAVICMSPSHSRATQSIDTCIIVYRPLHEHEARVAQLPVSSKMSSYDFMILTVKFNRIHWVEVNG